MVENVIELRAELQAKFLVNEKSPEERQVPSRRTWPMQDIPPSRAVESGSRGLKGGQIEIFRQNLVLGSASG